MLRSAWSFGVLMLLVLFCAGCEEEGGAARPREGQQVPILRELKGQQGPFPDRGLFVIQRQDAWRALWGTAEAPEVDFSRQSVLVALMGQRPTGGYEIAITDVRATGTKIVAYVTERAPAPNAVVTQAITFPYDMAVVPKLSQPVSFVVEGGTTTLVPIQDLFTGTQSKTVNPQTMVVRDEAAWRRFWADAIAATPEPPAVDFTQYMAVAVLIGRKPTAGYAVWISSVDRVDDRLTVNYRVRQPQPGETTAQVLTSPYAITVIPANTLPIAFRNIAAPAP